MLGARKSQLPEPTKRARRSPWRGVVSGAAALTLAATLALPAATPPAYADHLDSDMATVDEILDDPMAFNTRTVMVSGEVGEMLGPRSFTLEDGDLLFDEAMPVVANRPMLDSAGRPIDVAALDGRYVQVIGTVHQFNRAAFEDRLGIDLDDASWQSWGGHPALIASHVIMTPGYVAPVLPRAGVAPGAGMQQDMVTVDDIAENPAAHYGRQVQVNGEVEPIDEPSARAWAFALEDSDLLFDEQVLVVGAGPRETRRGRDANPIVSPWDDDFDGRSVWVTGEVRQFRLADFERELGVDLDDGLYADWENRPAILARSIRIAPAYTYPYGPADRPEA